MENGVGIPTQAASLCAVPMRPWSEFLVQLYNPVWTSAVLAPRDFALASAGFLLLTA
jgi:hypothetical protein